MVRTGYDVDGVLCFREKWSPERKLINLKPKNIPVIEKEFAIITGRDPSMKEETMAWLYKHNVRPTHGVHFVGMLDNNNYNRVLHDGIGSRKAEVINRLGIEIFYEDDPDFIADIRRLCPQTTVVQIEREGQEIY